MFLALRLYPDVNVSVCRCLGTLSPQLRHDNRRHSNSNLTSSYNKFPNIGKSSYYTTIIDLNNINPTIPQLNQIQKRTFSRYSFIQTVDGIMQHSLLQKRTFSTSSFTRTVDGNGENKKEIKMEATSKWLTVPNALTLFRMGISPYIGYLVLCEQFSWALGLVFLAAVTDSVDGWIARNVKGQMSNIGSYIDPLADKIMISVLTLTLTVVNIIPVPLCGMIILRDVLLVGTSSHFHYKNLEPPRTLEKFLDFEKSKVKMEPTQISKFNTFLQLGLVTISVAAPVFNLLDHPLLHAYWYLVATTTVISGLSYVVKDKSAYKIK